MCRRIDATATEPEPRLTQHQPMGSHDPYLPRFPSYLLQTREKKAFPFHPCRSNPRVRTGSRGGRRDRQQAVPIHASRRDARASLSRSHVDEDVATTPARPAYRRLSPARRSNRTLSPAGNETANINRNCTSRYRRSFIIRSNTISDKRTTIIRARRARG